MHNKKSKVYRKNEWRKVMSFFGDEIIYKWRPSGRKYIEIKFDNYDKQLLRLF